MANKSKQKRSQPQPIPQSALDGWLASEDQWFQKGSQLYHTSQHLLKGSAAGAFGIVFVGEAAVNQDIGDKTAFQEEADIIAEMLHAMAVECWLKGLLIMQMPRQSEAHRVQAQRIVFEQIGDWQGIENLHERLLAAMNSQTAQEANKGYHETLERETSDRVDVIRKHTKHNLLQLARMAGLILGKEDIKYLNFLSEAIMLGRYPGPLNADRLIAWRGNVRQIVKKESLNKAIFRRYDELLDLVFQDRKKQ